MMMNHSNIIQSSKTKLKWKDCKKYKDTSYRYPTCQLQSNGDDLCYKMIKYDRTSWYITILNYKQYTALDIMNILEQIGWNNRHTVDALFDFYKNNDLDLGFTKRILKDFKR